MNTTEFTDTLTAIIRKAFYYKREFMERFWRGNPDDELLECYVGIYRSRIYVRSAISREVETTTISTSKFIEWAESMEDITKT